MTTNAPNNDPAAKNPDPSSTSFLPEAFRDNPSLKDFKSLDDLLNSHLQLRSTVGADKNSVIKIPHDGPIPDEVWKRLGKPEKYELSEGALSLMSDKDRAKFLDTANKSNLTKGQFHDLTTMLDAQMKENVAAAKEQATAQRAQAEAALKAALGEAYDQNINLAKNTLETFNKGELWQEFDKSGLTSNPGLINLLAEISKLTADDGIVEGQRATSYSLTPEQAKDEIASLRADPEFMKRYTSDVPGHKEAVARMHKLYQTQYPNG